MPLPLEVNRVYLSYIARRWPSMGRALATTSLCEKITTLLIYSRSVSGGQICVLHLPDISVLQEAPVNVGKNSAFVGFTRSGKALATRRAVDATSASVLNQQHDRVRSGLSLKSTSRRPTVTPTRCTFAGGNLFWGRRSARSASRRL